MAWLALLMGTLMDEERPSISVNIDIAKFENGTPAEKIAIMAEAMQRLGLWVYRLQKYAPDGEILAMEEDGIRFRKP